MEKAVASVKSGLRRGARSATAPLMDAKTERERRLAEALRVNLRRRKAQARALDTDSAVEPPAADDGPPPQ